MTKVTDHTDLADGTEFTTDPVNETLTLTATGDLVDAAGDGGGVTGPALFSALEDAWRSGTNHWKYRYPYYFTTGELGNLLEMRGGTEITAGDEKFIRDCGVRYRSGFGGEATVTDEWCCLVGLGSLASGTNQCYVLLDTDTAPANLQYTGLPNELVKIYDSAGDDDRGSIKVYLREWGNTFVYYDLNTEQSVTTLLPVTYSIPMETVAETNGTGTDGAMQSTAYIDANTPYTGMGPTGDGSDLYEVIAGTGFTTASAETLTADEVRQDAAGRWFICTVGGTVDAAGAADYTNNGGTATLAAYSGEREVDGSYYAYNRIIEANSGTVEQLYEFHQRSLIKTTDVASGETQRGDTMEPAVEWVNGKLRTRTGFFVDNIASADAYKVEQTDVGGTQRAEPQVNTASVTNLPTAAGADTRLRIYNNDTATEVYNGDPASATYSATYTEGVTYTAGDSINIRFAEVDGGSTFKSFETTVIASSTGWSVDASAFIEANSVYATNGVDGSSVTKFTYSAADDEFNLAVAQNFSAAELFAFYAYTLTTSAGIANAWGAFTAIDTGNYRNNTSVVSIYLDNETTATQRQTDSARIFRDDDAYPVNDPTTSGYGIDVNWKNPVYVVSTGGTALTPTESAALLSLPSATDIVDEWESQSQADPTGFMVNVKEINGATVQGDGTDGDAWRGDGVDP